MFALFCGQGKREAIALLFLQGLSGEVLMELMRLV
jgi:hypothetical protein